MSRKKRNPELKHITRMDYPREDGRSSTIGWWVRFYKKNYKTGKSEMIAQKSFPDRHYDNDKEKSLAAAKEWRNKKKEELGLGYPFRYFPKTNSSSGVSGVFFTEYVYNKKNKLLKSGYSTVHVKVWIAHWTEEGKVIQKSFSVFKWGETGAFRQAVDFRHKKERELAAKSLEERKK